MTTEQTAVGVLDLKTRRLAMIHPDRGEYAASVPKIGILLAWFQLHSQAATNLDAQTRHELGLMVKTSDNEMATKFSQEMGLKQIQAVLNSHHLYDKDHGGGIWVGKHYARAVNALAIRSATIRTRPLCDSCCVFICYWSRANLFRAKRRKRCVRFLRRPTSRTTTSSS